MPPQADFTRLREKGIHFNACSLSQLEMFGSLYPGGSLGIRFNPGLGSGGTSKTNVSGPVVWQKAADLSLNLVRQFPEAATLNLGGGYKVARMAHEKTTDLQEIG